MKYKLYCILIFFFLILHIRIKRYIVDRSSGYCMLSSMGKGRTIRSMMRTAVTRTILFARSKRVTCCQKRNNRGKVTDLKRYIATRYANIALLCQQLLRTVSNTD